MIPEELRLERAMRAARARRLSRRGLAALAALSLTGCDRAPERSAAGAARTATVAWAEGVEDVFVLSGELQALRSARITVPRTDGRPVYIRWLAEDGSQVAAGDPVAHFDSTSVQAAVEELRTSLRQAEIERESRERALAAEHEQKQVAVDRAELEAQKAAVDAEVPIELRAAREWHEFQVVLLQQQTALEKARLDLEAFEASSRAEQRALLTAENKARRELEAAETSLRSVSATAPSSGIFMIAQHWRRDENRKFEAGDQAFVGLAIATIPELGEMEVLAQLADVDHGRVAVDMPARVVLDTHPDQVYGGRVTAVASVASESMRRTTFSVRVALERADPERMRPGMSARVEVVRASWPRALVVPRAGVRFGEDGRARVRTRPAGGEQTVELEGCTPLVCVVASGLDEGTSVRLF